MPVVSTHICFEHYIQLVPFAVKPTGLLKYGWKKNKIAIKKNVSAPDRTGGLLRDNRLHHGNAYISFDFERTKPTYTQSHTNVLDTFFKQSYIWIEAFCSIPSGVEI